MSQTTGRPLKVIVWYSEGVHGQCVELPILLHQGLLNLLCHFAKEFDFKCINGGPICICETHNCGLAVHMQALVDLIFIIFDFVLEFCKTV